MRYSKEERDKIGKRIFDGEITINAAAVEYGVNPYTARDYYRVYKAAAAGAAKGPDPARHNRIATSEEFAHLSRDELIDEIIKSKIEIERLKKGYSMEGGGYEGVFRK